MLASIVSSITVSVETMSSNQQLAQHSVELAQKTVESLSHIQQTIMDLSRESHQVAKLAGDAKNEVTTVMGQVDLFKGLGTAVAEGGPEIDRAALELTGLSASLTDLTNRFKI